MVLEMKLCVTQPEFLGKNLHSKNLENGLKIGFFEFKEKLTLTEFVL